MTTDTERPNAADYANKAEREAAYWRERCEAMGRTISPIEHPLGDDHHTDVPFSDADSLIGQLIARDVGDLFVDVRPEVFDWQAGVPTDFPHKDTYFYNAMTSVDVWSRVARALRIHGLRIVNAKEPAHD